MREYLFMKCVCEPALNETVMGMVDLRTAGFSSKVSCNRSSIVYEGIVLFQKL